MNNSTLSLGNYSCGNYSSVGQIKPQFWPLASIAFLLAISGFAGNLVSIYILQKERIISNFNRLLIMLSYYDAAYIFLFLLEQGVPLLEHTLHPLQPAAATILHSRFYTLLFVYFLYPVQHILLTATVIMVTLISIDRYIAVLHPFTAEARGHLCRTLLQGPDQAAAAPYSLAILLLSAAICVPHFFDFRVVRGDGGGSRIALHFKLDHTYSLLYRSGDFVIRVLLPIFIMRKNYTQIFRVVENIEPEISKKRTLFSMMAVFMVCNNV
jgi:hypothetical protein